MCYNPIHIINPRVHKLPYLDSMYLTVPCGKCWQCRSQKSSDWFVRNFFEFKNTQLLGGCTLFVTLTFNNANLPSVVGYNDDFTFRSVPCFSSSVVDKWLKRLRINLFRNAHSRNRDVLRYFIVGEYGDEFHRPHYHVILNCLDPHINAEVLRLHVIKSWKLGIVSFGSKGAVLSADGESALAYVAKYVCKDVAQQSYFECLDLSYRRAIEHFEKVGDKNSYDYALKNYSDFLKAKPSCRASKHFGLCAFDKLPDGAYKFAPYVTDELLLSQQISVSDKFKGVRVLPLPRYYIQHLFYDKIVSSDSVTYRLNEIGIKSLPFRYELYKKSFSDTCERIIGSPLTLDDINKIANDFLSITFCNKQEFVVYLRSVIFSALSPSSEVTFRHFMTSQVVECSSIDNSEAYELLNIFDRSTQRLSDIIDFGFFAGLSYYEAFEQIYFSACNYRSTSLDYNMFISALLERISSLEQETSLQKELISIQSRIAKRKEYRLTHHINYY